MKSKPSIQELQPIFVVGNPKSGTTLLQALLDGHPQLLTFPIETNYYRKYEDVFRGTGWWAYMKFQRYFLRHGYFGKLRSNNARIGLEDERDFRQIDFRRFEDRVRGFPRKNHSRRDFFLALIDGLREAQGVPLHGLSAFVEKTPLHLYKVEEIISDFPNARFVQVLRDPRDTFLALAKTAKVERAGMDYTANEELSVQENDEIVSRVKSGFQKAQEHRSKLGSRYEIVDYRNLVRNAKDEMQRVAAFCGIDFVPDLLDVTLGGVAWTGNSSSGKRFAGIDESRLDVWKRQTSTEIEMLDTTFRDEISDWDYEIDVIKD